MPTSTDMKSKVIVRYKNGRCWHAEPYFMNSEFCGQTEKYKKVRTALRVTAGGMYCSTVLFYTRYALANIQRKK